MSAKKSTEKPRGSRVIKKRFFRLKRSRALQIDFIEAKDMALLEVVVVVAIVETVADLRRAHAEVISTPSLEFEHPKSVRDTNGRDCASYATRRDTVSSDALS
jgi:hypothetical protein